MEHKRKYARILVPVDGSQESLRAVRLAGEIACVMVSTVYLIYVSPYDESTDEGDVSWLPESIVRPAAEEAQEIFAAAKAGLPEGIACRCRHRIGIPADEILRFVDEIGVDLVVIGGCKLSRVSGFLLGSVTQTVLERANTRVVVAGVRV